jgi:hypothetical protein
MYVEVRPKHNSTMVSDASPGTANPKMNNSFVHTAQMSSDHRIVTSNIPLQPLLMVIRGRAVVGFVLVLELADV